MAGSTLKSQWKCITPGCPESGEGPSRKVDLAARKHGEAAGHSTVCWQVLELPLETAGG